MRRCRRKGRCVGERKEEDGRDMLSKVIGSAGSWWTGVGSLHPSVISLLTHLLLSAPIYVLVIIFYIYST